jgi:PncC family amidohydrolase
MNAFDPFVWIPRESVSRLLERLAGHGWRIATAESVTGGLLGAVLTSIPGASRVYTGGIVSYCDDAKRSLLGVPASLLEMYGAVSREVAIAMAGGCRQLFDADLAMATTGVAGPAADAHGTPVGTVFVAYATRQTCRAVGLSVDGTRDLIRSQSVIAAVALAGEAMDDAESVV